MRPDTSIFAPSALQRIVLVHTCMGGSSIYASLIASEWVGTHGTYNGHGQNVTTLEILDRDEDTEL